MMKKTISVLAAVLLFAFAVAAYSQSLADLAKKEKERRQQVKSQEKVITNQDTSKFKSGDITTVPLAEPAPEKPAAVKPGADKPAAEGEAASKDAKPAADEPVDLQGRPESFWRQSLADARKKVKDLENEGNVLILKVADLRNQFYRESDGFKQMQIQQALNKAFSEQNLNEARQNAAKKELTDLINDARKSGALPGWLDEKPS